MIRAQKLKSVFSTIGVFIGVTFLIGAWSVVNGMNRYMTEKFAGTLVGVNTFHLRRSPNVNFDVQDSVWRSWRRRPRIKFADANAVTKSLTVPVVTAWYSEDRGSVEYNGKVAKDITLEGATERYFDIMNLTIGDGRPFTPQESKAGTTVVVLGYDLAHKLFPDLNPIGHNVRIHGIPYRVIGVVERQGNLLGISLDKFVVAPALSPIQREVNPPGVVDALIVKANSEPEMREAMNQAEAVMRSRRHLRPRQDDNFAMETSEGVLDFWNKLSRILYAVGPGGPTPSPPCARSDPVTPLLEGVGIALESLRAHKARAALTILGVAIGVMVVMVIGAIVSGFNKGVADMLEQSGPKTFWVGRFFSGCVNISDGSDEMSPWRHNPPNPLANAQAIARLPRVSWVALDEGGQADVTFGAKTQHSVRIFGRSAAWPNVAGGDVSPGRSFTEVEDAAAAQVAVVNQKLAELLFDRIDPIGQRIHIQGVPYTVIGVFNPPPQLFGGQPSPEAIIPHGALIKYVRYWKCWMDLLVGPAPAATTAEAMEDVTEALRLRRHLRPGQDNNFAVVSQEKFLEKLNSMTLIIRFVLFILSAVGLIVGGVGVIAIMMISVTERTREIGVRKALGATRREILWQFLVEAATPTLVGGVVGMIGGGLAAVVLALATPIPAHVPLGSVVVALIVAALTGVLFGLYPASRAARLDPVEALRYE